MSAAVVALNAFAAVAVITAVAVDVCGGVAGIVTHALAAGAGAAVLLLVQAVIAGKGDR